MGNKISYAVKDGIECEFVIDKIAPLDIIFYKGDGLVSTSISTIEKIFLNNGDWSHVGLVITNDLIPIINGKPNEKYIWETFLPVSSEIKSCELDKQVNGLQIRKLVDVVDFYDDSISSKIGWSKLINNPYKRNENDTDETYNNRIIQLKTILTNIYNEFTNKSEYQTNMLRSIGAIIPFMEFFVDKKTDDKKHRFFCSEFVTYIYQSLGLISDKIVPGFIAPVELIGFTNNDFPVVINKPVIIKADWIKKMFL